MKKLIIFLLIFCILSLLINEKFTSSINKCSQNIKLNKLVILSCNKNYLDTLKTTYIKKKWLSSVKQLNNKTIADSLAGFAIKNSIFSYNDLPFALIFTVNNYYKKRIKQPHTFNYKTHNFWVRQFNFFNNAKKLINISLAILLFFSCLAILKSLICHNKIKYASLHNSGIYKKYFMLKLYLKLTAILLVICGSCGFTFAQKYSYNFDMIIILAGIFVIFNLAYLTALITKD